MFSQLAGAAILGVGIWVKVDRGSIFGLIEKIEHAPNEVTQLLNMAYLFIALGSVLLIIGFLGCCGVVRQSKCMLLVVWIYVVLLTLTLVLLLHMVYIYMCVYKYYVNILWKNLAIYSFPVLHYKIKVKCILPPVFYYNPAGFHSRGCRSSGDFGF